MLIVQSACPRGALYQYVKSAVDLRAAAVVALRRLAYCTEVPVFLKKGEFDEVRIPIWGNLTGRMKTKMITHIGKSSSSTESLSCCMTSRSNSRLSQSAAVGLPLLSSIA